MRTIQSFNYSVIDTNQNLEKTHYSKAEGVPTEMAGFHETAKYTKHECHKTKLAGKSREVGCLSKVNIGTSLHEHLMWPPGTLQQTENHQLQQ